MVGGNTGHLLGVTDKILTHAEIKHYTNEGLHNEYKLVSRVIETIHTTKDFLYWLKILKKKHYCIKQPVEPIT
jgi:hypothetical protein